jgi:allophanate hydrolase
MIDMTLATLSAAYADGSTPADIFADIRRRCAQYQDRNIWIHLLSEAEQRPYLEALAGKDPDTHPLWGIPFAIKDNIDLAGIATTAACEAFAYTPDTSAFVVAQLIEAGAVPVGKTNLDQFATGLNGTRSPWGPCRNAFDPDYVSGGSSAGSAVAVALGLATFSLGTDTAGSGRVPAGFNNLVGLKPSRGLLSNSGMVRACRSLDCISVFALTTDDADAVLAVAEGIDTADEYSRANPFANRARHYGRWQGPVRAGIIPPDQLEFFGDEDYARAYGESLAALADLGFEFTAVDYVPFLEAARLLYEGPWVAERYLATRPLIEGQPEAMLEVIRAIIEPGGEPRATELFAAQYRLEALRKACLEQIKSLDCLLTPTTSRHFRIDEMLADPIRHNSELGQYTNFVNLLDFCALAVPTTFTATGLPFGITLVADHFSDRSLLAIGNRIQSALGLPLGATDTPLPSLASTPVGNRERIEVAVCGAHLDGLPLNWQLTERGASLLERTQSAPHYRLYALAGGPQLRPGMVRAETGGAAIEVEVWSVPAAEFGSFVAGIPAPLGIGKVQLSDGRYVSGFICDPCGLEGAEEITGFGGWRAWLASR